MTAISTVPNSAIRHRPLPAYSAERFSLPAPSWRLKFVALPIPSSSAMAVQAIERGNAMLVAALPSRPTPCPIKIWSTMLYSDVTSIEIMQGMAKPTSSLPSFSYPSGLAASACNETVFTLMQFYLL